MAGDTEARRVIDDPVQLAKTARVFRTALERHQREIAEHGECRTCAAEAARGSQDRAS